MSFGHKVYYTEMPTNLENRHRVIEHTATNFKEVALAAFEDARKRIGGRAVAIMVENDEVVNVASEFSIEDAKKLPK